MRKVREKIMARAMISRSCANFLSDVDLKPGIAQSGGALNKRQHQNQNKNNKLTKTITITKTGLVISWIDGACTVRKTSNA